MFPSRRPGLWPCAAVVAALAVLAGCSGDGKSVQNTTGVVDATPPTWTSGYPQTANIAATSLTLKVHFNENATVYWVAVDELALAPTSAQTRAGVDYAGVTVRAAGNGSAVAFVEGLINVTGLNPATSYDIYAVGEDATGNLQAAPSGPLRITTGGADATPPVWATGFPATSNLGATSVDLDLQANESGRAYYVVLPDGALAPLSTDIRQGTGFNGATPVTAGNRTIIANAQGTASITGLNANTAYDIWVVAEDNVPNLQSSPVSLSVTTLQIDTTAPAWASTYPSTANVGSNSVDLRVKITEAGEVYWVVLTSGAAAPTSLEVWAGTGSGGASPVAAGNRALSANLAATIAITGLSDSTTYHIYVVAQDTVPNIQGMPAGPFSITTSAGSDTTPPAWIATYPSTSGANVSGVNLNVQIDESGTVYWLVLADGASAPSSADVKAGSGAIASGSRALAASTAETISVGGLSASTAYDLYAVAEDNAATPNLQTSPTKLDFSTTAQSQQVTISIDGVMDAAWSQPGVLSNASSLGEYNPDSATADLAEFVGTVYVGNNTTDLFIGVAQFEDHWFEDDPANTKSAHLHFYISTDLSVSGPVDTDNFQYTDIDFSASSLRPHHIGHLWSKEPLGTTTGGGTVGWGDASNSVVEEGANAGTGATAFAEVRIPLSAIGSPGPGAVIGVIVGARGAEDKPGLIDIAPWKQSATTAWGDTRSAVDPTASDYIQYTIK